MQKNRGAIVELYGLAKETNLQGMKVIRPLLNYTKKELETYCVDNKIIFGVDETNFDFVVFLFGACAAGEYAESQDQNENKS